MPIATHHSPRRERNFPSLPSPTPQKKDGGRVAVIAVAAAGRSITTRFVLGRELGSGRITCVRLTGRGCHAGQLTFPALLDCRLHEDGTCSFERPTSPHLSLRLNTGHGHGYWPKSCKLDDLGLVTGFWKKEPRAAAHDALQDARCCAHGLQWLRNLNEKKEAPPPPQPKPCQCGCTVPEVKGNGIGDFYVECPQCHRRSDQSGCEWSNHAVERWNNDHLEGADYDG